MGVALLPRSRARQRTRAARRHGVVIGVTVLALMTALCAAAPLLTNFDPLETNARALGLRPGVDGHLLGTDSLGRDLWSRALYGGRTSLLVGVLAAGLAMTAGTLVGAIAGLSPGRVDTALTWLTDALLSVPQLVVAITLQALLEPSLTSVVLVIGLTGWMEVARVVRAQFLTLRERDWVRAAVALGTPRRRVLTQHLLPVALVPILAISAYKVSGAMLTESTLSFLGLGVPPHQPTWGNLLTSAQQHLLVGIWWDILGPGVAIVTTILAVTLVADGIRPRVEENS